MQKRLWHVFFGVALLLTGGCSGASLSSNVPPSLRQGLPSATSAATSAAPSSTPSAAPSAQSSASPPIASATPTSASTATPTSAPTATPTSAPTATPTASVAPSVSPLESATPTASPTLTSSPTPLPSGFCNIGPPPPVLVSPANNATDVSLTAGTTVLTVEFSNGLPAKYYASVSAVGSTQLTGPYLVFQAVGTPAPSGKQQYAATAIDLLPRTKYRIFWGETSPCIPISTAVVLGTFTTAPQPRITGTPTPSV